MVSTILRWPHPGERPAEPAPPRRRHRLSRRERLRRFTRRVRRTGRNWGGAAVDGLQLTFQVAGEFLAALAVLTVTITIVSFVMGAGR